MYYILMMSSSWPVILLHIDKHANCVSLQSEIASNKLSKCYTSFIPTSD